MLDDEEKFMYDAGGASECITEMLDSGMFVKSYRDIESCKELRGKLSAVIGETVDNYCMPEIFKEPNRPPEPTPEPTEPTPTPQ